MIVVVVVVSSSSSSSSSSCCSSSSIILGAVVPMPVNNTNYNNFENRVFNSFVYRFKFGDHYIFGGMLSNFYFLSFLEDLKKEPQWLTP